MTAVELLLYLSQHTPYDILDGDPAETLAKARLRTHRDALVAQIISAMVADAPETPITRADAISALGPIRLAYMKDDAPVAGFRMVEGIVHAIDGAFNDETLRKKAAGAGE